MFLKISQTLFNKVTNLQPCNFIKKRLRQWGFPAKFAKILSTPFLKEHLQWLFLFLNESITFINSFSNIFNYSLDFKKEFGSIPRTILRKYYEGFLFSVHTTILLGLWLDFTFFDGIALCGLHKVFLALQLLIIAFSQPTSCQSQVSITCSQSTIETLENGVTLTSFWCFYG